MTTPVLARSLNSTAVNRVLCLLLFVLPLVIDRHYSSSCQILPDGGPYIDSLGFRAAQLRLEAVEKESPDSLINKAFRVQNKQKTNIQAQPDFFQSIEEDYQRYRKLFTLHRRGPAQEVYCAYDLLETFRLEIFDSQPFFNAILHTLSLPDVTTFSFDVVSRTSDRLIVRVAWSKAVPQADGKSFSIAEGHSDLKVTDHWISLLPVR